MRHRDLQDVKQRSCQARPNGGRSKFQGPVEIGDAPQREKAEVLAAFAAHKDEVTAVTSRSRSAAEVHHSQPVPPGAIADWDQRGEFCPLSAHARSPQSPLAVPAISAMMGR
jgi:hypothetical protein